MIDRTTGRVVHIDFGDCFEVLGEGGGKGGGQWEKGNDL
jgi:hypothetical protein